jgi:predicted transcriptional regulator of viral defense system
LATFHGAVGPDVTIAKIASRQLGLVTRRQLLNAGLSASMIDHRLRTGRLHRIQRGVYAVGHTAFVPFAEELAAVLACGDGAVLSHRSAAVLWGLLPTAGRDVEVTVPRRAGYRSGIRAYQWRLESRDIGRRKVIPATSLARPHHPRHRRNRFGA